MLTILLPVAGAFVQPTTSDAYRRYLIGDWDLRKKTIYVSGGLSGRFEGTATFRALDGASNLVSYVESGTFTSNDEQFGVLETRNRLLYDFSDWAKIDVLYDLAEEDRSSIDGILAQARLLYSLSPDTEHAGSMRSARTRSAVGSTGDEEFWGELEVSAADSFLSTWNVQGPGQAGQIMSLFRRQQLIV
jgi:hypothetical protein